MRYPSFSHSKHAGYKSRSDLSPDERIAIIMEIGRESEEIFTHLKALFGQEGVPIIGYGSLMNLESAKRSIQDERVFKQMKLVRVQEHTRIFNVNPKEKGDWEDVGEGQEGAVLNILMREDAVMNAVLFSLGLKDFQAVRLRESFYDLVPVLARESSGESFLAYAYQVRNQDYLDDRLMPIPDYYRLVVEGVKPDFFDEYLDTTYLGSGESIRKVHHLLMDEG